MITFDKLRNLALSLPEVTEEPHFSKTSFRVKNKIFATYSAKEEKVTVKLSEIDQDVFSIDKTIIHPVENKWGKQGWTIIDLQLVNEELFSDALRMAYFEVAPKNLIKQLQQHKDKSEDDF
ncbi:MmcQ/YjbR family DNA-binding protein [Desertivirga arenae]|uniref:MmcQ/YjbR family DNA-binding protein n=1 Tax=Desertivirga arenae TaxID=2810309 RepID=UPI001A95AC4F|nr:MmcQ/YjbR family DNA-binding protein [Pedobacter sp. SYSU D00823]